MRRYESFAVDDIIDLMCDAQQKADLWCRPGRISDKYKDETGDCKCDCELCLRAWLMEEMDGDDKAKSGLLTDE